MKALVSESWNATYLDSGANEVWYNCYINSLNENKKRKIKHHTPYNFGDGTLNAAPQNVEISHWEAEMWCKIMIS